MSVAKHVQSGLAILAGLLGVAAAAWDGRAPAAGLSPAAIDVSHSYITAPDLAERILREDPSLVVRDLRPIDEFEQLHIPTAASTTLDALAREPLPTEATVVIYGDDERRAFDAWVLLRRRGYQHVFLLRQGLYEWISRVLEPRLSADATADERVQFGRAARLSRFFGGVPRANVDRAEVPAGYWSGDGTQAGLAEATRMAVANVRRRGC